MYNTRRSLYRVPKDGIQETSNKVLKVNHIRLLGQPQVPFAAGARTGTPSVYVKIHCENSHSRTKAAPMSTEKSAGAATTLPFDGSTNGVRGGALCLPLQSTLKVRLILEIWLQVHNGDDAFIGRSEFSVKKLSESTEGTTFSADLCDHFGDTCYADLDSNDLRLHFTPVRLEFESSCTKEMTKKKQRVRKKTNSQKLLERGKSMSIRRLSVSKADEPEVGLQTTLRFMVRDYSEVFITLYMPRPVVFLPN